MLVNRGAPAPGLYVKLETAAIRKFGTRGVCLLILGTLWSILGGLFLITPTERFSKLGPGGLLDFLDRPPVAFIFSCLWVIGGAVALVTAFQRPVTCKDDVGFNGVVLPPFVWGLGYWWSFIVFHLSDGDAGRPGAYLPGALYWDVALLGLFLSRHLGDHPEGPCAKRSGPSG